MSEELFYIQDSRSYCGNDILWWGKDRRGYTTNLSEAGVYTKNEAVDQHNCRETDIPWPKGYVDAHSSPAVDMQCVDIKTALKGTDIQLIKPQKPKKPTYRCDNCGRFVSEETYYSSVYHGHKCPKCENDF